MITNLNDLVDLQTAGPISSKQFITAGSFVSSKDGAGGQFSQSIEAQNLVAVTVTVDANRGVANQITPGDHVDIAVPQANADGSADTTYNYMLSNVKVLAAGATTTQTAAAPATAGDASSTDAAAAPPPQNSGVLTFEVSKDDALRIISANGNLYLVLLPPSTVTSAK
jgi:Flp pilus assembly protein CpaB